MKSFGCEMPADVLAHRQSNRISARQRLYGYRDQGYQVFDCLADFTIHDHEVELSLSPHLICAVSSLRSLPADSRRPTSRRTTPPRRWR
jgi:hypothetical protein